MEQQFKMYVETPEISKIVQRVLAQELNADWGVGEMPFNLFREWIVITYYEKTSKWNISWADWTDYDNCPAPEYALHELMEWGFVDLAINRSRQPYTQWKSTLTRIAKRRGYETSNGITAGTDAIWHALWLLGLTPLEAWTVV